MNKNPQSCKGCKVMDLLDEFNRNLLRTLNTTELKYSQDVKAVQESLESAMLHIKE